MRVSEKLSWRGLAIRHDRLWLRIDRIRGRLRFDPDGLTVIKGQAETIHSWDTFNDQPLPSGGWSIQSIPGSRYNRPAVALTNHAIEGTRRGQIGDAAITSIPASWVSISFASDETAALAKYLASTNCARAPLADHDRLVAMLSALAATPKFSRLPPGDHMMGDKLDVDLAIHRVLDRNDPRYFDGRPIRGEHHPTNAELVPLIRAQLPRWVTDRVSDDQIGDQLERFRNVRPWPFDALLG